MMDGSARAVELAEDAQTILAKLETDVKRYAHLRFASTVLAQAIERYREKHQGPILKRTNELFAHLTLNSFKGVRADFDDHDNPVLVGVRGGGEEVRVEGMSDGTNDQLYLALRLASLETYLKKSVVSGSKVLINNINVPDIRYLFIQPLQNTLLHSHRWYRTPDA